jgi:hypothetical protein
LAIAGCQTLDTRDFSTALIEESAGGERHAGLPLQSGDIVVSDAGSADGVFQTLTTKEFYPWGHSGVIVIENGRPYVYEAFGNIKPHISGPPTDATSGVIRRVSLAAYVARNRVVAVFEPAGPVVLSQVADFARRQRELRTPFDPYFDDREHQRLYCTEFVALALEAGGAPPVSAAPVSENRSMRVALHWLKVDAPEIIPAASLVRGARRIALLSRQFSPAQVRAYFAMKEELHRRFTPGQRLGSLFTWSKLTALHARPEIIAFRAAVLAHAAAHPKEAELEAGLAVRRIAANMLGSFEAPPTAGMVAQSP